MATSMAQINVKIPAALKTAGDQALGEVGLNASELIRSLWEAMAARGAAREKVTRAIVEASDLTSAPSEQQLRMDAARRGASIVSEAMSRMGIDIQSMEPLTDEELDDLRYEHLMGKLESKTGER